MNLRDSIKSLPRDDRGVRVDVEGNRDLSYSKWHRTIAPMCLVTDVDFLEYRIRSDGAFILKAIFEIKKWHVTDKKYVEGSANFRAIQMLSARARLPLFHVWYYKENYDDQTEDIKKFLLWDTSQPRESASEMTPNQMKVFIENL